MTPSVAELLHVAQPDLCVCGQRIPRGTTYYAVELDPDNDAEYAYGNSWHDHCLGEWSLVRDDSEFGVRHCIWD